MRTRWPLPQRRTNHANHRYCPDQATLRTAWLYRRRIGRLRNDEARWIELFFSLSPEHDPKRTASRIYVRVTDADRLHEHWRAASIPGLRQLRNTHYNMREFTHVDPDGNMILFGSRL